jgi:predicted patatin/cPLA2 family phospholipase
MKTGVIDVGGGLRGIYGAGVLDRCLEDGVRFDCCIGVSAGSANIASYLAGQKGRNYPFYYDYPLRPEYMSAKRFVREGNYLSLDYIYGTLSNHDGENPLDFDAMMANPASFFVEATRAEDGRSHYFTKRDFAPDDYRPLMASCCIPVVNRPYELGGVCYYDGGVAEPVPLQKAFDEGCERVVVILTKPIDPPRAASRDLLVAALLRGRYPQAAERLACRAGRYNSVVEWALVLQKQGKVLVVAPDDIGSMKTLTRDQRVLDGLYRKGCSDGAAIAKWLGVASPAHKSAEQTA